MKIDENVIKTGCVTTLVTHGTCVTNVITQPVLY